MIIKEEILYELLEDIWTKPAPIIHGFRVIEHTINGADESDGGASYDVVIQEVVTGKYYAFEYNDWDLEGKEIDNDLLEVFAKQKTITVYER